MSWSVVAKNLIYKLPKKTKSEKLKARKVNGQYKVKVKKTNRQHKKQSVVIDNKMLDFLDVDYPELKNLIVNRRKELIKNQTQAESMMIKLLNKAEDRLRKGYKQFVFGKVEFNYPFVVDPEKCWFWFADFYFKDLGIVIELDGGYHNEASQQKKDLAKDTWYSSQGFRVLRVANIALTGTGYDLFGQLIEKYAAVPAGTIKKLERPIRKVE